jgi:hypothetical protein
MFRIVRPLSTAGRCRLPADPRHKTSRRHTVNAIPAAIDCAAFADHDRRERVESEAPLESVLEN